MLARFSPVELVVVAPCDRRIRVGLLDRTALSSLWLARLTPRARLDFFSFPSSLQSAAVNFAARRSHLFALALLVVGLARLRPLPFCDRLWTTVS